MKYSVYPVVLWNHLKSSINIDFLNNNNINNNITYNSSSYCTKRIKTYKLSTWQQWYSVWWILFFLIQDNCGVQSVRYIVWVTARILLFESVCVCVVLYTVCTVGK